MLSDTLKKETLQPHQQLEKHLVQKIKSIETVSGYTTILKGFYGFISPLEKQISEYAGPHISDMYKRRKLESLVADISFFEDFTPQNELMCSADNLPVVNSAGSAMGALYVFEGSTLGGEIITALIAKKLNIPTDKGFAFFRSYDDERMPMWLSFKNTLDAFGKNADAKEVVSSAKQTLTQFYYWLSKV